MSAKVDKSKGSAIFDDDDFLVMAAGAGAGPGGSGNNGGGIGGGGGSPGGGSPGGGGGGGNGGGGGKPGGESFGNNLSFPAIFFETAPTLRGSDGEFTFTTPTLLTAPPPDDYADYVYFAQGVEGNTWRADYLVATEGQRIAVDFVDLGDALESAPLKAGTNVRLELSLYQDVANPDPDEPVADNGSLTAFAMELLGGAKGSGKPDKVGPTESQGARLDADSWHGSPVSGTTADTSLLGTTTYESELASIYAAETPTVGEGETTDSYMSMTVQRVTGLAEGQTTDDAIAALNWNGSQWVDANGNDGITVEGNLANTAFGPELNIGGKYIMGASGKPFKFTSDGNYLITFAVDEDSPFYFDEGTAMTNIAGTRATTIVQDAGESDGHDGLLVMLVGIPSTGDSGGGEDA
jgi:hypothetical protein